MQPGAEHPCPLPRFPKQVLVPTAEPARVYRFKKQYLATLNSAAAGAGGDYDTNAYADAFNAACAAITADAAPAANAAATVSNKRVKIAE